MTRLLSALTALIALSLALSACGPVDEGSAGVSDQQGLSRGDASPPGGNTEESPTEAPDAPGRPTEKVEEAWPSIPAQAPADPLAALPVCTEGGVLAAITKSAIKLPQANSNAYRVPEGARLMALEASFASLLGGDVSSARTYAATAEYTLCRGEGEESQLVLWKAAPGEGQARIVLRTGKARPAIFEAPHPLHDAGTMEQSLALFQRLDARALIVSGTHRCANAEPSGCSGTTTACGGEGPFRISDAAHAERSAFQTAHRALSDHFADHLVIGVHGMGGTGASVSDGTTLPTTADSPSAKLAARLAESFGNVTTCNAFSGGPPRQNRLCGTTDVQGRHLNGVLLACTEGAPKSSGRFIHLEQAPEVRAGLDAVTGALDSVIP